MAVRRGNDDVTHWVLQPTAARQLQVPFLVAGATTVGSQLASALAMGACGVEVGTAFMATKESPMHQNVKERIASPLVDERSSIVLLRSMNNTGRFYRNDVTEQVAAREEETPGDFSAISDLMAGDRNRESWREGNPDNSAWTMGMSAGMITDVVSCQEFIDQLIADAEDIITKQLQTFVVEKARASL